MNKNEPMVLADIVRDRFTYKPPKGDQPKRYEEIRDKAKELALFILANTQVSREQALSLTHLDEVVFWANASIARNE